MTSLYPMITRRQSLQYLATGLGAAVGSSVLPRFGRAASRSSGGPKRVVFFLQNNGFDPRTCIPDGMKISGSLANATLPEPMAALQPYRERMHIINAAHNWGLGSYKIYSLAVCCILHFE